MKNISYQDEVEKAVCCEDTGRVFAASAIYHNKLERIPEFTYYKALERMVNRNKLIRLAKGLYLRPDYDTGEGRITEELIRYYTAAEKNTFYGFQAGNYLLDKYNLLNAEKKKDLTDHAEKQKLQQKAFISESTEQVIYTSRISQRSRRVQKLLLLRLPDRIQQQQLPYYELLELLNMYEECQNRDDFSRTVFEQLLHRFAAQYDDRRMTEILRQQSYPKRLIAFMREVLQQQGCENSLNQFLAGTSRYRIPNIDLQEVSNE